MKERPAGSDDESPFVRTLAGPGIPGAQVVTDQSGMVFTLGERVGASGNVYEALCSEYSQPIVVKLFPRALAVPADAVETFTRQALQMSEGNHPNVGRVLQAGMLDDGVPFLVAERLRGETVKELLDRRGSLSSATVMEILRSVGAALTAAHEAGIVHGELCPDNIFLVAANRAGGAGQPGAVKLLDFGVAALTAASRQAGGQVSPDHSAYLAPEQTQKADVTSDPRVDVYGLSVTAQRLQVGRSVRRSPAVDAVLSMASSGLPDERFESIGLFLTALEEATAGAALLAGGGRPRLPQDIETTPVRQPPMRLIRRTLGGTAKRESGAYGTMTKEFFDEGDRMSEEAAEAAARPIDYSEVSMSVPRNRGSRLLLGFGLFALVGAIGAGVVGGWQPLLDVGARAKTLWEGKTNPAGRTSETVAAGGVVPAPAETPAAAPVPAAPIPSEPAAAPAPVAATPPAAALPAAPALRAVAVPPRPASDQPPREEPAAAAEPPRPSSEGRTSPGAGNEAPDPDDVLAPGGQARVPAAAAAGAARSSRRDPLRGYVWSPSQRRLVPSSRAAGSDSAAWPPPSPTATIPSPASPGDTLLPPPVPPAAPPAGSSASPPSASPSPGPTEPPAVPPPPLPDPAPVPRPE